MPLRPGSPIGSTIKELHGGKTYARTKSKFGKARANAQAIAIAMSNERKRAAGGATGIAPMILGGGPIGIAAGRAMGGPPSNPMASWSEHQEARSLMHGPIMSSVPGRTDAHHAAVPSGSYVVPADIVSGRGQGNTAAGMNVLQHMFRMGPYGSASGMIKPGRMPSMQMPRMAKLASGGGKNGSHVGKPVPVNLAGGELVIPPEKLLEVVHPDLRQAHAIMDAWVLKERKKLRKTLAKLPGPARD